MPRVLVCIKNMLVWIMMTNFTTPCKWLVKFLFSLPPVVMMEIQNHRHQVLNPIPKVLNPMPVIQNFLHYNRS